jgi:hypothetical protein
VGFLQHPARAVPKQDAKTPKKGKSSNSKTVTALYLDQKRPALVKQMEREEVVGLVLLPRGLFFKKNAKYIPLVGNHAFFLSIIIILDPLEKAKGKK